MKPSSNNFKKQSIKKTFLLLALILMGFTYVKAQSNFRWADSASVWHYTYNLMGVGYAKYSYVGDTVLNNKNCQKIIGQTQEMILTGPGVYTLQPINAGVTIYLYKSSDSVFTYRNSNFYLAFKTNATVGEIWDLGVYFPSINNKHAYAKVDSVFYNAYNGVMLRNMQLTSCDSLGNQLYNFPLGTPDSLWLPGISMSGVNEKFGPWGELSIVNGALLDYWLSEGLPSSLLCFQSDSFPLYQFSSNTDCNNNILTEVNDLEYVNNVSIFPIPAKETLTITNVGYNANVSITDVSGKIVLQTILNASNQLNINHLSSGLYFLHLESSKGMQVCKVVKE